MKFTGGGVRRDTPRGSNGGCGCKDTHFVAIWTMSFATETDLKAILGRFGGKTSGCCGDRRRVTEGGYPQHVASLVWGRVVGILTKLLQRTVRGPALPSPAVPDPAQEIATLKSALRPGSSVVERGPEKAGVGGSIPSLATILLDVIESCESLRDQGLCGRPEHSLDHMNLH